MQQQELLLLPQVNFVEQIGYIGVIGPALSDSGPIFELTYSFTVIMALLVKNGDQIVS